MFTYFQKSIMLKGLVPADDDARHIEGYIRIAHSTVNDLSWPQIRREVKIALACINEGGVDKAERCAQSFGL